MPRVPAFSIFVRHCQDGADVRAYKGLGEGSRQDHRNGQLYDILYAGDTLLIGVGARHVEELARAMEKIGLQYGLMLHWGKTQALSINTAQRLKRPDGTKIEEKTSLLYLGALIDAEGRADSELSRRIGMAVWDFQNLQKLWRHAGASIRDKLTCLDSFVVSKLLYGLSTMYLVKSQRRRINGFYARCLRRILRIPAAYISRVSNVIVFEKAKVLPLTEHLEERQLALLGCVARSKKGSPLRRNAFTGEGLEPLVRQHVRKVGRPRLSWAEELLTVGGKRFGSSSVFADVACMATKPLWNATLCKKFQRPR